MKNLITKILKIISITIFVIFSSFISLTYAETLTFKGATYEGNVKNGKANGIGIFTFDDGSKYEGDFKDGLKHSQLRFGKVGVVLVVKIGLLHLMIIYLNSLNAIFLKINGIILSKL